MGEVLNDPMKSCLELYRDYLLGCCLFRKEEDVFAFLRKKWNDCTDGSVLYDLQWGQVIWYFFLFNKLEIRVF